MSQPTFKYTYPTSCCGKGKVIGGPTSPPVTDCDDCLFIPNFIYAEDVDMVPCGPNAPVGTIDLKQHPAARLDVCRGTLQWDIIAQDDEFFSLSIANGVISLQFKEQTDPKTAYYFLVKVTCSDPQLSIIAKIGVMPYNMCSSKSCGPGEVCDPCTGNCVPLIDIEVT